jgi:hypothetical protein
MTAPGWTSTRSSSSMGLSSSERPQQQCPGDPQVPERARSPRARAGTKVWDRAFLRQMRGGDVPHYHFDLVDSKTVADEEGADLPDDIQALDVAEEIAKRLLKERPELEGRHFSILVTNRDGEEIGRVPLDVLH